MSNDDFHQKSQQEARRHPGVIYAGNRGSGPPGPSCSLPEAFQEAEAIKLWPIRKFFLFFDCYNHLEGTGRYLLGRCPFHEDPGQALVVDTATNAWQCSECLMFGDVIDFLANLRKINRAAAAQELLRYVRSVVVP